jgi:hypothetical protein
MKVVAAHHDDEAIPLGVAPVKTADDTAKH